MTEYGTNASFTEALKDFLGRLKPKVSKERIASLAGISRGHLCLALAGRRRLGLKAQEKLANVLGFPYQDFILYGRGLLIGKDFPDGRQEEPSSSIAEEVKAFCRLCTTEILELPPFSLKRLQAIARAVSDIAAVEHIVLLRTVASLNGGVLIRLYVRGGISDGRVISVFLRSIRSDEPPVSL